MRGHGFTVIASGVEECIFRAIYTNENAMIQTTSILLNAAHAGSGSKVQYLHEEEASATADTITKSWARPWGLWTKEVEAIGLYVNNG